MSNTDLNHSESNDRKITAPIGNGIEQANQDAQAIAEKLRTAGSEEGYKTFLQSVEKSKKELKPTEMSHYSEQLSKNLEKEKVLPQLSLNWTEHAFKSGKLDLNHTGAISRADIHSYTKTGSYDVLTRSMAAAAEERLSPAWQISDSVGATNLHFLVHEDSQNNVMRTQDKQVQKLASANADYILAPRAELGNKSLFQAADIAGAKDKKQDIDGKVQRHDFEALLQNPFVQLSDKDRAFVKKMVEQWDKPEYAKMGDNGTITQSSIAALKKEKTETADVNAQEPQSATIKSDSGLKNEAEFLLKKRPELSGKSIFEAADIAGAKGDQSKVDRAVQIQDIRALLNEPFVNLDTDTRSHLSEMSKNWNLPKYAKLRDAGTITLDSLTAAKGGLSLEEQRAKASQESAQKAIDARSNAAYKLRAETRANADYLLSNKVNGIDLVTAAAKAGGNNSKSVDRDDFEQLLKEPFANLSDKDKKFIANMLQHWDEPDFVALRDRNNQLSLDTLQKRLK